MNDQELKVIIGHKPPTFDVPLDWQIITLDHTNKKDLFIEDDSIWSKNSHGDVLAEFSYLIPLAKKLKTMPQIKTVRIAQYRKVVANAEHVNLNKEVAFSDFHVIKKAAFGKFDLNKITQPESHGFLFSECLMIKPGYRTLRLFNTLTDQYVQHHHLEDFLRFVADAVHCEVLTEDEANLFLHMNKMIIGGIGLGTFPTDSFIAVMDALEKTITHYYTNSWIQRKDSYQYRNISFLSERLSSFLLMKELDKKNIKLFSALGRLFLITEEGKYTVGSMK